MDQLGGALRRGGIKDLLVFLPANKRDPKALEDHFKKEGLPQVAEWFAKRQYAVAKDSIVKTLKELCEDEARTNDEVRQYFTERLFPLTCQSFSSYSHLFPYQIIDALKTSQEEQPIPPSDFVGCIWLGLTSVFDFNSNANQVEQVIVREVDVRKRAICQATFVLTSDGSQKYASVLEPFCDSGKTQVALINAVQVYCYEEQRATKSFPQLLKVKKILWPPVRPISHPRTSSDIVQQGLCFSPGYYLLAPEGCEASGQAELP